MRITYSSIGALTCNQTAGPKIWTLFNERALLTHNSLPWPRQLESDFPLRRTAFCPMLSMEFLLEEVTLGQGLCFVDRASQYNLRQ